MNLSGKKIQVARPSLENSLASGVVGTAYTALAGADSLGLYILYPEDEGDLAIVSDMLFTEAELEEVP